VLGTTPVGSVQVHVRYAVVFTYVIVIAEALAPRVGETDCEGVRFTRTAFEVVEFEFAPSAVAKVIRPLASSTPPLATIPSEEPLSTNESPAATPLAVKVAPVPVTVAELEAVAKVPVRAVPAM